MYVLTTTNLSKTYRTEHQTIDALKSANIHIVSGEFACIVGTSGSGKSTLLNLMGGLDTPTHGSITVNNTNLKTLDDEALTIFRRRNIGFIFQSYNLIPSLSVKDNILLPLGLDGTPVDLAYFNQITTHLSINDKLDSAPSHLSGGQRQRIAIARALITKPAIILADEPTGNLDSKTSADVIGLLKLTANAFQQTVIMVSHNESIAQMADHILHIEDGEIIGDSHA